MGIEKDAYGKGPKDTIAPDIYPPESKKAASDRLELARIAAVQTAREIEYSDEENY